MGTSPQRCFAKSQITQIHACRNLYGWKGLVMPLHACVQRCETELSSSRKQIPTSCWLIYVNQRGRKLLWYYECKPCKEDVPYKDSRPYKRYASHHGQHGYAYWNGPDINGPFTNCATLSQSCYVYCRQSWSRATMAKLAHEQGVIPADTDTMIMKINWEMWKPRGQWCTRRY